MVSRLKSIGCGMETDIGAPSWEQGFRDLRLAPKGTVSWEAVHPQVYAITRSLLVATSDRDDPETILEETNIRVAVSPPPLSVPLQHRRPQLDANFAERTVVPGVPTGTRWVLSHAE